MYELYLVAEWVSVHDKWKGDFKLLMSQQFCGLTYVYMLHSTTVAQWARMNMCGTLIGFGTRHFMSSNSFLDAVGG